MAWVSEAENPISIEYEACFSPIVKNDLGQYIVYWGDYPNKCLYRYNLNTNEWTELASPSVSLQIAIAMSPDGSRLAAPGYPSVNILNIYDIAGNSWSTSSAAPNIDGVGVRIGCCVWTDNDTVWCQVRAYIFFHWYVKVFKYVVSTDTWTQYTNSLSDPAVHIGHGMSINSEGTTLFVAHIGANYYSCIKYVIATDTYSTFSIGTGGWRFYWNSDRTAKLWFWDALTSYLGTKYYDCDTEAVSDIIFPHDSEKTKPGSILCGIYGVSYIIAQQMATEPKNRSYLKVIAPTVTTDPATEIT